jgi:hypothetical protein
MSRAFWTLLGAVGPASVSMALIVSGLLSQRLGAVTKMPRYYRWFFVAAGLVAISALARLLGMGGADSTLSLVYTVSFALGVTVGLVVAWRYWSWLFGEQKT